MRKRDPSRRELEKIVRKDAEHQLRTIPDVSWLQVSDALGYEIEGATIVNGDGTALILEVDRGPGKKKHRFHITVQTERIS